MDTALAQTVEALLDPTRVTWNLQRPDPGELPQAHEIYLGVGAREVGLEPHPRMMSWKLPQWRAAHLRSTTEAVLRSAEALDGLQFPLVLRTHEPTLDLTCAALLAVYRLLHRRWPQAVGALTEYVSEWEQGRTENAGHYERALASVFYASMHFRAERREPTPEMITLLAGVLERELAGPALAALPPDLIPARITRRLKADTDLYRTELSRGWKVQLDLPLENEGEAFRRIDALFLSSPQDVTVLKLLARPDQASSSYQRGFELLAVHAPNEPNAWGRHTISIAPESPGSLADLAARLDAEEGDRAPDGTPRVKGMPRFSHQPASLGGLSDPWYSDGYAWPKGRSTIVAPPFVGTRLTREQIWEATWQRFNVGRHVHITASRTVYVRPSRATRKVELGELLAAGWKRSGFEQAKKGLLASVSGSFFGDASGEDVVHLERPAAAPQGVSSRTVHLSLYPSNLALLWVEETSSKSTLLELTRRQAHLAHGRDLDGLPEIAALAASFEPAGVERWLVYGAYRLNRARSTMLDASRSVHGLFHALASGHPPTLQELPTQSDIDARRVQVAGDVEHWFTSTGGARLELKLEDDPTPPALDQDFALFLLTTGQRYVAFEIARRMGAVERKSRTSRWQTLKRSADLRGDVMMFTNSLWYTRVSDEPELDARYDAWRELHGMTETVESLRTQTTELDEYRKERFESMVQVLLFVFLPITIVCGFFSGAQFNEMPVSLGLPWTTGGWIIFLIYTAVFTVLVFGAVVLGRLMSWRKR